MQTPAGAAFYRSQVVAYKEDAISQAGPERVLDGFRRLSGMGSSFHFDSGKGQFLGSPEGPAADG